MYHHERLIKLTEHPSILKYYFKGIEGHLGYIIEDIFVHSKLDYNTFIDVGFNNGEFSKAFNYKYPNCRICAIEPMKEKFDKSHKFEYEGISIGLWDKSCVKTFNIPKERKYDGCSSVLKFDEAIIKEGVIGDTFERQVRFDRFDNLKIKIQRPCLVKIDVEGTEMNVLRGFGKEIDKVDAIFIELNFTPNYKGQSNYGDIIKFLSDKGFKGFKQSTLRILDGKMNNCDLFFSR